MKIYKTGGYNKLIEEIEVTKVDARIVWLSCGRRVSKRTNYANYWDTLEEAKSYLKSKFERDIKLSESNIQKLKSALELLKNYN